MEHVDTISALDLLANAALQSETKTTYTKDVVVNDGPVSKETCVVKLLNGPSSSSTTAPPVATATKQLLQVKKEDDKFVVPSSVVTLGNGRKMTVVKINKQKGTPVGAATSSTNGGTTAEHPYSYVCQLAHRDEDEGYSSRSSMDSPTDGLRSPDARSPDYAFSDGTNAALYNKDATPKQATKIIIVSSGKTSTLAAKDGRRTQTTSILTNSKKIADDSGSGDAIRTLLAKPTANSSTVKAIEAVVSSSSTAAPGGAGVAVSSCQNAVTGVLVTSNLTAKESSVKMEAEIKEGQDMTKSEEQMTSQVLVVPSSQLNGSALDGERVVYSLPGGAQALLSGNGSSGSSAGSVVYVTASRGAQASSATRPRAALLQAVRASTPRGAQQTLILPAATRTTRAPKRRITGQPRAVITSSGSTGSAVMTSAANQYIIQDDVPPLEVESSQSAGPQLQQRATRLDQCLRLQTTSAAAPSARRSLLINRRPPLGSSPAPSPALSPAPSPAPSPALSPAVSLLDTRHEPVADTPDAPEAFIVQTDHGERDKPALDNDEETSSLPDPADDDDLEQQQAKFKTQQQQPEDLNGVTSSIGRIGSLSLPSTSLLRTDAVADVCAGGSTEPAKAMHSYVKRRRKSPHLDLRKSPRKNFASLHQTQSAAAATPAHVAAATTVVAPAANTVTSAAPPADELQELHPVVEHDYCAFTSFNAEIQSSILATTQCKPKMDSSRRYGKRGSFGPNKHRKYNKRKDRLGRLAVDVDVALEQDLSSPGSTASDAYSPDARTPRRGRRPKNWVSPDDARGGKKHKKRTYSTTSFTNQNSTYQDEFVYYGSATARKKNRKSIDAPWRDEDHATQVSKPKQVKEKKRPQVGGMKLFDWYREMAEEKNKLERFNTDITTPTTSKPPSPEAVCVVPTSRPAQQPLTTPVHESEVADLVCALETMPEVEESGNEAATLSSASTLAAPFGLNEGSQDVAIMDMSSMEELARSMISNMGEAELQELGQSLTSTQVSKVKTKAESSNAYNDAPKSDGCKPVPVTVASEVATSNPLLSPSAGFAQTSLSQGSSGLLNDLADIDFLPSEDLTPNQLGRLLGELTTPVKAPMATDSPDRIRHIKQGLMNGETESVEAANDDLVTLNQLPPQPSTSSKAQKVASQSRVASDDDVTRLFQLVEGVPLACDEHTVPELTTVQLFWNDLPAVVINGIQYVRLVDIHKQVLPSKDTGILKKRCQVLRLGLAACTEMQRDFLIRYAQSAKSKSQVVISAASSEKLISFYAEPRLGKGGKGKVRVVRDDSDLKLASRSSGKSARGRPPGSSSHGLNYSDEDHCANGAPVRRRLVTPCLGASRSRRNVKRIKYDKLQDGELETASADSEDDMEEYNEDELEDEYDDDDGVATVAASSTTSSNGGAPARGGALKLRIPRAVIDMSQLGSEEENVDLRLSGIHAAELRRSAMMAEQLPNRRHKFPEEYEMLRLKNRARRDVLTPAERMRLSHLRRVVRRKDKQWRLRQTEAKLQRAIQKLINQRESGDGLDFEHRDLPLREVSVQPEEAMRILRNKRCSVELDHHVPLGIVHKDNTTRSSRGKTQEACVHLHLYHNDTSPCVECETCHEFLSIKKFLRHQHVHNRADELIDVFIPQCITLRSVSPTDVELNSWAEFRKRLNKYDPNIVTDRVQGQRNSSFEQPSTSSLLHTTSKMMNIGRKNCPSTMSLAQLPEGEEVKSKGVAPHSQSSVSSPVKLCEGESHASNSLEELRAAEVPEDELKDETRANVVALLDEKSKGEEEKAITTNGMTSFLLENLPSDVRNEARDDDADTEPSEDTHVADLDLSEEPLTSLEVASPKDEKMPIISPPAITTSRRRVTSPPSGSRASARARKRKQNEDFVYASPSPVKPDPKRARYDDVSPPKAGRRSSTSPSKARPSRRLSERTPPGATELKQELRRVGMSSSPRRRCSTRAVAASRAADTQRRGRNK